MIEGKDYFIVNKNDSKLMKAIAVILKPFCPTFMTNFTTTIGRTIYCPNGQIMESVLAHELVHVADFKKYHVWFVFSYLLFPPMFITMRAFWEKRAYKETIRCFLKDYPNGDMSFFKDFLVSQFTGSNYLWMDVRKKSVEKWFDATVKELKG